jgi:hypothetical protein
LVVTVIITVFPISLDLGVYVNVNGDDILVEGLTEPSPSSFNVTSIALPPNVLPLTDKAAVPQVLPLMLPNLTVGGFVHCPNPSIEINKKRLTKRKTLVIFFMQVLLPERYKNITI